MSELSKQSIWCPYTQMKTEAEPIHIVSGNRAFVYDINNKKYIGAISSWWVNIHGHTKQNDS